MNYTKVLWVVLTGILLSGFDAQPVWSLSRNLILGNQGRCRLAIDTNGYTFQRGIRQKFCDRASKDGTDILEWLIDNKIDVEMAWLSSIASVESPFALQCLKAFERNKFTPNLTLLEYCCKVKDSETLTLLEEEMTHSISNRGNRRDRDLASFIKRFETQQIEKYESKLLREGYRQELKKQDQYHKYNWDELVKNLKVNPNPVVFSGTDPKRIEAEKLAFLRSPPVASLSYRLLLDFFDQTFFPSATSFQMVDPNCLVDFSSINRKGMPARISVSRARSAIESSIAFAEANNPSVGWRLDFRFYLKKVLLYLQKNPSKAGPVMVVMASAGLNCGPGNLEGARLAYDMLYDEKNEGLRGIQGFKDAITYAIFQLREEVFGQVVAFPEVYQTIHMENLYRNHLWKTLALEPPFEDPYPDAAYLIYSPGYFVRRFFLGKLGDLESRDAEARRHYHGYYPERVFQAVIDLLDSHPDYLSEIKSFFSESLKKSDVKKWLWSHQREALEHFWMYEPDNPSHNKAALKALSLEQMRNLYAEITFFRFNLKGTQYLNEEGLRTLLTYLEHLVPSQAPGLL